MADIEKFIDENGTNLNRYKVIREDGTSYYVFLERGATITTPGTILNAQKLNELVTKLNDTYTKAQTITQVNGMISSYMSENYENGNVGAY